MGYLGKKTEREMFFGAKAELFELALQMRKNPTQAEKCLWIAIKKFRKEGYPFRRQHPISFFIADFYCHQVKLVVEVDGKIHLTSENIERDDNRSAEFEKFGITIIRFTNDQILSDLNYVLEQIKIQIDNLSSPALAGAGDRRG
jgi:imidazole glycerol-phosphate synthase subunit HisF